MKICLVDNWRDAWRWWSMRLNAIASMLVVFLIANPNFIKEATDFLPEKYRLLVAPFVGLASFLIISWARMAKQKPKGAGDG